MKTTQNHLKTMVLFRISVRSGPPWAQVVGSEGSVPHPLHQPRLQVASSQHVGKEIIAQNIQ